MIQKQVQNYFKSKGRNST